MSFEKLESENQEEEKPKRKTSRRLMFVLDRLAEASTKEIIVKGRENLKEIPSDRKVVIATSHSTDIDVPLIVRTLGDDFDLVITSQSINFEILKDPMGYLGTKIAGKDNFLPIDYTKEKGKTRSVLNFSNLSETESAIEAMDKVPVIAGFNPEKLSEEQKPGYAVPYIAQLMGAVIVPVAVKVKGSSGAGDSNSPIKTVKERPTVEIIIGKPFELDKIQGIEHLAELAEDKNAENRLQRFKNMTALIKEQSEAVAQKINQLVHVEQED